MAEQIFKNINSIIASSPSFYIYYLPWLKMDNAIHINQLSLIPFPSKLCDEELKNKNLWVIKRLMTIKQNCINSAGKSITDFTYITTTKGPLIDEKDHSTQDLIDAFDLALNLLYFRYSNYDSDPLYALQLSIDCAAINPDQEAIYSLSRKWFYESWQPLSKKSIPSYISDTVKNIDFPLRRIREVFQALNGGSGDLRKRVSLAIRFLKLANIESTQYSPQICLELLGAAFEHLFEHPNIDHPDVFAFKLEDLWNYPFRTFEYHPSLFKNKQLKQATHMQTFRLAKQPSSKKTWLQAWFLEFFKLRNDLLFSNQFNPKEYAWNITQHLRVATEILPMTILIMLSRDQQTRLPLKNEDEKRIRKVDAFVQYARSIWYGDMHPSKNEPAWLQGKVLPNLWDTVPEDIE